MSQRSVRIVLTEEVFRKYKVYCAMNDCTMTEQTSKIVKKFVDEIDQQVKITRVK